MIGRWLRVLACAACLALVAAPQAGNAATADVLRDDAGVQLPNAIASRRVISLLPALSESVCALGACGRLVGVDRYSNYPASLAKLPQLGGGLDPNFEAIVALKPDVVLLARSSRISARLQALGITVVQFEPKTQADMARVILSLAHLLGLPNERAHDLLKNTQDRIRQAAQAVPKAMRERRVYFEIDPAPYAAGPQSFLGELLTQLQLGNIVPASLGIFPKLNPEFVLRADPDVVMLGDSSMQALLQRPGWSQLRAIRSKNTCVFNRLESDIMVRPGPRIDEAAGLIVRCLQKIALALPNR